MTKTITENGALFEAHQVSRLSNAVRFLEGRLRQLRREYRRQFVRLQLLKVRRFLFSGPAVTENQSTIR